MGPFRQIFGNFVENHKNQTHRKQTSITDKYSLFGELLKFRQNMTNYTFRKIENGVLIIENSEYFAKQIIFSNSPARKP